MTTITSSAELAALCERLKTEQFVTVDTEFLRENTYWPKLCLIQMASDDEAVAIDPLAEGMDLTPFFELMDNTNVVKVLHAARQDLEIFFNLSGRLPQPLFDTQVAAMVCGFGDSVGYETLVSKIVHKSLDKSHRYTDWSRRPLTEAQITYAIGDVTHLREIYRFLSNKLEKTGRSSWVEEEMAHLLKPEIYDIEPRDVWQRMKVRTNKPRFLALLREIAAWRERTAKEKDLPRNRVLKDETLFDIAAHPPKTADALEKIRGVGKGFSRSKAGKDLLDAIEDAFAVSDDDLPQIEKARPRPATPPMADLLKVLLKVRAQEEGVAPRLIANASDLEAWAAEPDRDFEFLQGWRGAMFGDDARKLLNGELALTSHNGEIDIVVIE